MSRMASHNNNDYVKDGQSQGCNLDVDVSRASSCVLACGNKLKSCFSLRFGWQSANETVMIILTASRWLYVC